MDRERPQDAAERSPERVLAPREVCARVGLSPAGLRRLAPVYERVHGDLPRDDRGRLWREEDVERLQAARDAVHAGRYTSTEAALRAGISPGEGEVPAAPRGGAPASLEAVQRLLEEMVEGQRAMISRMEALEAENRELRRQLEPPPPPDEATAEPEPEIPDTSQEHPERGLWTRARRWLQGQRD